ncbi:MAG: gamma-glutamyl-gamma-aminobutyrate hydrolase family protein [Olegusella sp.]|nr:gamma-glutamyl-gamma-aminobutyrate hydrolase family protein [Olegusella sp.]
MKPVIAVMPLWDDDRRSLWMLPGYLDGIAEAGGTGVMLPLITDSDAVAQLISLCDGVLLTGGHDVSPSLYGQEPFDGLETCPARDRMDATALRLALREDKPVLGICRGIQLMNAALGGTLWQDLPTQHPSDVNHHMAPPYDRVAHEVRILPGTPLHQLLGQDFLCVNSYHHQAVRDVAPGLVPMAVSTDGLVEAVYAPDQRFCWGVQWHPEFSFRTDASSRAIFRAFVDACR